MHPAPDSAAVALDRQTIHALVSTLRQLEKFFDECDETVSDALEAHVGIRPAAESYSAILEGHAEDLESALASPPRRVQMGNTSPQLRADPVTFVVGKYNGAGRYLLHLRDDREGIWEPWVLALLGGGRTRDDSCLEATLRRELAEEVPDLEPTELVPFAVEEATSVDGLAVPIQVYAGRWTGDAEAMVLREGVLLTWCTVDMLDRLRLSPGLGELIRRHAAEHPAPEGPPDDTDSLPGEAPPGTELHIVGVHLHLQDDRGRILLGRRHPDSAFAPDTWHFLAGHCEREAAIDCLIREAKEEAGLTIASEDVDLVHTVHHVDSPNVRPRIALVFQARSWTGDPEVLEPDRCVEWRWWEPQDLPAAVVPYTRRAIDAILRGRPYSEQGWGER